MRLQSRNYHNHIAATTEEPNSHNNDTNNQSLVYLCTNTTVEINHNSKSTTNNNQDRFKILIDSGASHTLINNPHLCKKIQQWSSPHHVALADGITTTPIIGEATIQGYTNNRTKIVIPNCLLVPSLSHSLLALIGRFLPWSFSLCISLSHKTTLHLSTPQYKHTHPNTTSFSITPTK